MDELTRSVHGAALGGLTLTGSIPLQNYCINGERGGWSWCESCGSALEFLAAAAAELLVATVGLRDLSLSCPLGFCATGMDGVLLEWLDMGLNWPAKVTENCCVCLVFWEFIDRFFSWRMV